MIAKALTFIKEETVLSISLILAIVSCLFVRPSINYINWHTIILLLVVMVIVEILKNLTIFEVLVRKLLTKTRNTRELVATLVITCFISSIFITNDVSLILFVPFAILALQKVKRTDLTIITVCLQTISANIGCMVLPIGAPHNIVIYTMSTVTFESFIQILLPYITTSLIFIAILLVLIPKDDIKIPVMNQIEIDKKHFLKNVLNGVDYYLLLTFIALFILIGNLENINIFETLFRREILGNEVLIGVLLSQIISNVPTAMLLSGFSQNYEAIIIGINIGGFGTLIASMANLISYNLLIREHEEFKRKYLTIFTGLNITLLIILLLLNSLI